MSFTFQPQTRCFTSPFVLPQDASVQHADKEVLASAGGNGYTSGKFGAWSLSQGFAQPVLFLVQNSHLIIAANGVWQFGDVP